MPKIGHAGTLDPFATGLLILLLGNNTKRFDEFQAYKKEYVATIRFGIETETYDKDGQVTRRYDGEVVLDKTTLLQTLHKFTGEIQQVPPRHSAVKIHGKRAYEFARKGKAVSVPPRNVSVYEAELLSCEADTATIRFLVSSGTYIRSLAHDIGKELHYGAHLSALRRTKIGPYSVEDAERV
jgi:tRNA pseudouridine55 synthase